MSHSSKARVKGVGNPQSVEDRALSSALFVSQLGSAQDMNERCKFSPSRLSFSWCVVVLAPQSPIMEA